MGHATEEDEGQKGWDASFCRSVCLSANISPKSHILSSPNSPILLRMLAVARSFCGDVAIGYVLSVLRITSSISEKRRVTKDVVFF